MDIISNSINLIKKYKNYVIIIITLLSIYFSYSCHTSHREYLFDMSKQFDTLYNQKYLEKLKNYDMIYWNFEYSLLKFITELCKSFVRFSIVAIIEFGIFSILILVCSIILIISLYVIHGIKYLINKIQNLIY